MKINKYKYKMHLNNRIVIILIIFKIYNSKHYKNMIKQLKNNLINLYNFNKNVNKKMYNR